MFSRLINWFTVEPAISLLMTITAVVIFGSAFTHKDEDAGDRFWPWLRPQCAYEPPVSGRYGWRVS